MTSINIIPNFVDANSIQTLNEYARGITVPWIQTNDSWNERFVHLESINNQEIKSIINSIAVETGKRICDLTNERIGLETCQLVRWKVGDQLDPPHADAEHLDGSPHPYAQRHYSALVYLNNDFEGGKIFFPNHNLTPNIEPGMLVHFTGTTEDLHGVTKVTAGMRYTIVMFFTRITNDQ